MAAENFKVKKGLEVGTGITATSSGIDVTGIVTATTFSGAFSGDGSAITGVTASGSGVIVRHDGSNVGTAGTIDFSTNLDVSAVSAGIVTITATGGSTGISTVSGVVSIANDLDVDGHTELDNLNVAGVSTFTDDVHFHGYTGITSITYDKSASELRFKDNARLKFGNGQDLHIYHSGGGSIIREQGTGDLTLTGQDIVIQNVTNGNTMGNFVAGGSVKLHYDGGQKFITTNEGVLVSGGTTTGTLSVSGLSTFTGNIDANANLDVDGETNLDDVVVAGVSTFNDGITLGTNSTTFAAKFADDAVANFGTDHDLKISHDNVHARITNSTGDIVVSGIISATSDVKVGSAITMDPTSGIITATSFSGSGAGLTSIPSAQLSGALPALDGSALTGVTASGSGIVVQHDGSAVGTAGTVNFSTNLDVTAVSAGIVTITASGGTSLTSDAQFNTVGGTNAGDSFSGTSANSNTLFGYDAGTNISTADRNTFIGFEAGKAVTAGVTENVFIGYKAGLTAQTSQQNVSVGSYSLQNMNHTSHKGSTAIGHYSLYTQTSGKDNCGLGRFSGYNVTEGEENVFLGSLAGYNNITTGSNNIIIGYEATGSSATVSNEITLGNSSITKLRLPGIGHTFTGSGAFISGIVTATTFSGSGASLTSLDAGNLGVGTIPNGRFPATLPAASGANLTSLTAGNISGTLATGQIADEAVTFAKMQHVGTGVFIGRNDSGSGDIETLTAAEARTLLNVADGATAGITTASTNVVVTWDVVNNSGSSYRFTGPGNDGVEDNPDIYLVRGQKYRFAVNASTHPFYIKTVAGTGTGNQYTDGVTGNGAETGNVEFNVQHDAPASLFYQCSSHGGMVGNIYIVGQHLANGANNRVLTATSAYGINAESNMTFDGDDLTVSHSGLAVNIFESTDNHSRFRIKSGNSSLAQLEFADQSDADAGEIRYDHANEKMTFHVGSNTERVGINSSGDMNVTGIITASNVKDSRGDLRNMPQVSVNSNRVVVTSDKGKHIKNTSGGWTINTSTAWSIGDIGRIVNHSGSSQTLFQASGVTIYSRRDGGVSGDHSIVARGAATIICTGSNEYYVSGDI